MKRFLRNAVHCLPVIGVLTLSGCTHVTEDVYATFQHHFSSAPDAELSAEEIAELPYTAIYARDGKEPQAVLILGFVDTAGEVARFNFISRSRQTLVMEHGRIVRTDRLGVTLADVTNRSEDPLRCIVTEPQVCPDSWTREADIVEPDRALSNKHSTETIYSSFVNNGRVELALPAETVTAWHVTESGRFEHSGKRFTNEFWLEEDGHVVKSIQHITPNHPRIELTQIKWVGR